MLRGVNNRNNRAKKEKKVDDIPNSQKPAERESTIIISAPQSETDALMFVGYALNLSSITLYRNVIIELA